MAIAISVPRVCKHELMYYMLQYTIVLSSHIVKTSYLLLLALLLTPVAPPYCNYCIAKTITWTRPKSVPWLPTVVSKVFVIKIVESL